MSVRRHSSSLAVGQGSRLEEANASLRRSISQEGSSRPLRKASKVASVKPPVAGGMVVWLVMTVGFSLHSFSVVDFI